MNTIAQWVQDEMKAREWNSYDLERESGISRTAVNNMLNKPNVVPRLDTLERLADVFDKPLWRVIEITGFDLNLPPSPSNTARRLQSLAERQPAYQQMIGRLLSLHPGDLEGVLTYLEAAEVRRERQGDT